MDTGSHGAVAANNYILIDSSATEVIKLWGKKGSFISGAKAQVLMVGKQEGQYGIECRGSGKGMVVRVRHNDEVRG